MGYDLQAEFYVRGARTDTSADGGKDTKPLFVFLAQEISPPYACSLVGLSNAYREVGAAKVERAINLWRYCMSLNEWPAYDLRIHYAEPAAWQLAELGNEDVVSI
jgi:hypothetical protein